MSSNIMSKPVEVSKYGVIFAGVQKNMAPAGLAIVIVDKKLIGRELPYTPNLLSYKTMLEKDSMLNTPPCYNIYMLGLVLKWVESQGGLPAMEERKKERAKLLYDCLDSSALFVCPTRRGDRSDMNVPFRTGKEELDAKFIKEAAAAGPVSYTHLDVYKRQVVSYYLDHVDPVHHITIIPHGAAGGMTVYRPQEDKSFNSKSEMFERIVSALGGRVAEKLMLDDISTGASGDIQQATAIARAMVTKYGMSDRLGPISFDSSDHSIFIGRDFGSTKSYSEKVAAEIDDEVKRIFDEATAKCEGILKRCV